MNECSCRCGLTFTIEEERELTFTIGEVTVIDHDPYQGEYIVNPKFVEQVLPTKYKSMRDNVTVLEIQVEKVTNLGGGYTVTIGG